MSNYYKSNPIVLDTYSSIINLATSMTSVVGTPVFLQSIEWQTPVTVGDTALITDKASGNTIFAETCTVANQSIIKYYNGVSVPNLYIAISGVSSGKIIITLV